eukprot:UN04808
MLVAIVAGFETHYGEGEKGDYEHNPVQWMMMMISFGSGMTTVYFRSTYGVVTNRLTGNIYRVARYIQDLRHGENKCPNGKLTCF